MLTRKLGFMIGRRAMARQPLLHHGSEVLFQLQSLPSIQTVPVLLPFTPQRTVQHRGYSTERSAEERIQALVKNDKVFIFMKGVPDMPRCGFSNAGILTILTIRNRPKNVQCFGPQLGTKNAFDSINHKAAKNHGTYTIYTCVGSKVIICHAVMSYVKCL